MSKAFAAATCEEETVHEDESCPTGPSRNNNAATTAQNTEREYRKLFNAVRDVAYILSPEGVILALNPAFEQFTGWTCAEWIGRHSSSLIHPDDLPLTIQRFQRLIQGETLSLSQTRIMTRAGAYKIAECLETPETHNGRVVEVLGIARDIRDITERERAKQALHQSEERFRQVVENIREVFWVTDPDKQQIFYISPGYEQVWGRTCESLYAPPRSWLESIHPEDRSRILDDSLAKQATATTTRSIGLSGRTAPSAGFMIGPSPFEMPQGQSFVSPGLQKMCLRERYSKRASVARIKP